MTRILRTSLWVAACTAPLALALPADAATVQTKQCGTAELAEQPGGDAQGRLYFFTESGKVKVTGAPGPLATGELGYVCKGLLLRADYLFAAGPTRRWKLAAATCTYDAGGGNRFRASVKSEGWSIDPAPLRPPVLLEVKGGTGSFANLRGRGTGTGSLPIAERSGPPPTCMPVTWTLTGG